MNSVCRRVLIAITETLTIWNSLASDPQTSSNKWLSADNHVLSRILWFSFFGNGCEHCDVLDRERQRGPRKLAIVSFVVEAQQFRIILCWFYWSCLVGLACQSFSPTTIPWRPRSTKHNPTQVKRPSCNAATAHSSRFWFLNQNALELARTQTGTSAHANWNYPLHAGAKASRSWWGLDFGWRQNEILLLKHLI